MLSRGPSIVVNKDQALKEDFKKKKKKEDFNYTLA